MALTAVSVGHRRSLYDGICTSASVATPATYDTPRMADRASSGRWAATLGDCGGCSGVGGRPPGRGQVGDGGGTGEDAEAGAGGGRCGLGGVGGAAAIRVLRWAGAGSRPHPRVHERDTTQVASQFALPMAELDSLDTPPLQSVHDGLEHPLRAVASPAGPSPGALTEFQLARALTPRARC